MQDDEFWLDRFEEHRPRLRAVAYRMLGSQAEADDALQETWLRISPGFRPGRRERGRLADDGRVAAVPEHAARAAHPRARNRSRCTCRDPVVVDGPDGDPAEQSALADTVGIALLVVLDSLEPAERLAFVLHDMFGLPFDDIAPLVERTPAAARQLASRARRRVQGRSLDGRPDPRPAARRGGRMGRRVALGRLRGPAHPAAPGRGAARRRRSRVVAHEDRPRSRGDRRLGDRVPPTRPPWRRGSRRSTGSPASSRRSRGQAVSVLASHGGGRAGHGGRHPVRPEAAGRPLGSAEDARRGPGQRRPMIPITGGCLESTTETRKPPWLSDFGGPLHDLRGPPRAASPRRTGRPRRPARPARAGGRPRRRTRAPRTG